MMFNQLILKICRCGVAVAFIVFCRKPEGLTYILELVDFGSTIHHVAEP